jgi:hypothetical protein
MSTDYFGKYFTSDGFDFPNLIHDDFMKPIKLLFNNEHYVSASKLLMTFIDSVGYVEYGESSKNPFIDWLNNYADLSTVGVTSAELWEQRNSLLHMSNLDSRKVVAGKEKRLFFYIGSLDGPPPIGDETSKCYSFWHLILALGEACENWFKSYDRDRNKISGFIERYDLIASDSRMLWIKKQTNEQG